MSEKKPMALVNALIGIFVQAVLNAGLGVLMLVLAAEEADHGREAEGVLYLFAYVSIVIGVVLAACGVLLMRRVEWARIPVAAIEVLGMVSGLIGLLSGAPAAVVNIALGAIVLVSLFKADTSAWLAPRPV
jgi:hypothetical protein